jgi:hypothetical protein
VVPPGADRQLSHHRGCGRSPVVDWIPEGDRLPESRPEYFAAQVLQLSRVELHGAGNHPDHRLPALRGQFADQLDGDPGEVVRNRLATRLPDELGDRVARHRRRWIIR